MRILLTNDDGIYAPGLRALRLELQKIGTVEVVAPATEQSATGHSVTLNNPIVVQEIYDEKMARIGWAVEGRPADCVKLALRELLGYRPDIIVSGLNAGSNAGINVLYSGTVAAAIEGAFFGITSIACSLEYTKPRPLDFNTGAGLATKSPHQVPCLMSTSPALKMDRFLAFVLHLKTPLPTKSALINAPIPEAELISG
jgi:5'-nucleotidase